MNLEHIKQTAVAAAVKGGEVLLRHMGRLSDIRKKGAIDLVTEADVGSEKAVIDLIRSEFPRHGIWAEESGKEDRDDAFMWIIDPLDGTTNFAHGLEIFSVSIAFSLEGQVEAGVVFNPVSKELFTAIRGNGAHLNGRPIRVSNTQTVSESLLVTGFPYNFKEIFQVITDRFNRCIQAAQGVRRLGSASLDLCFVACGRFDGFWEQNLKPWDTAAGMLIAREAGGQVTDFSEGHFTPDKQEILATNGKIHQEMISLLTQKDGQ
jgi:myo-inositol-1(or 4)-monophosphatase